MIDRDPYISIEAAEALHPSVGDRATIYRKIKEQIYFGKPAEEKSANGKHETRVRVASLPKEAQGAYWDQLLRRPDATVALDWTTIKEHHARKALRRFDIVQRAGAIQAGPRGERTTRIVTLAKETGVTVGQIYHWIKLFDRLGVPGLLPNYGQRKGRYRKLTPLLQDFIKQQYLTERRPSPMTVYERVCEFCREPGRAIPKPKYVTVLKFIKAEIPKAVADYHRLGGRDFEKRHEYKCWRDVSDVPVGAWITGDHRVADVWVYATSARDRMIRPWYTCYGDIRSRLIDGVVVDEPSSASIKLALRHWILQHGVPAHHYCDNGKDYECHDLNGQIVTFGKAGMPKGIKEKLFVPGLLSKLGVTDHDALPKKPWAKPIESWFKHVFTEWEKSLPGWCGNDPKNKPESLERDIKAGGLLTIDEFRQQAAAQIERWNQKEHGVLEGESPASLWQGVDVVIPKVKTLNLLLLTESRAKVTKSVIRAFGRRYYHESLYRVTGEWVSYFYDPANLGQLIVMRGAEHICNAVNDEAMRYGYNEAGQKELARRKRAQREASRQWPEHQRVIYRPEEVLAQASAQARDNKNRQIHQDPAPRPGTRPMRRILPGYDQAAAAAARATRATQPGRTAPAPSRMAVAVKPEPDFYAELLED